MARKAAVAELIAPAFRTVPAHAVSTAGPDAVDLASGAGLDVDPEQRLALDTLLAEDEHGNWAALENAIVEPRQNGKTVDLQIITLHELFIVESRLVIWSAHLFPTAQEAFRDLDNIIGGTPEFSRRVKRVSRANGEEGFEFFGDRRLQFRARSKTGGRGLSGDAVILDEAFALGAAEMGSLLPTLSARPNPHVFYASSAGLVSSGLLRNIRDRGRKPIPDESLAYIEFCADDGDCARADCDHRPGTKGCLLDDEARWKQANPAIERGRISLVYIRAERRALPPEEFARERLGWWDEPAEGASGIAEEDWKACANRDPKLRLAEPCTLALDTSPGQLSGAIVACGGPVHVVHAAAGTSWMIPKVVELLGDHQVAAVGIDPAGPAKGLIPDLERTVADGGAGLSIRSTSNPDGKLVLLDGRQAGQACEGILTSIVEHTFVHRDEVALNAAVAGAARRLSGDSWRWSRADSSADITPIVAATIARHLYVTDRPAGTVATASPSNQSHGESVFRPKARLKL